MRLSRLALPALACLVLHAAATGADLPPADRPVERVINQLVGAKLAAESVAPAVLADDATLIRRLTLDLVGRIPTLGETEAFVSSKDAGKRAKLIDRLMASPGFARHQAAQFEVMLEDAASSNRRSSALREYLNKAIKENRPWDRMFRELMLPERSDAGANSAAEFLRPRLRDPDRLTNDVSVVFFGVNVSCAQCHDHPHVKDWTQDHFYGLRAFLERTYDVGGGVIAERGKGVVRYKPVKGAERVAPMMFLTGTKVTDPAAGELTAAEEKKEKAAVDAAKKEKKAPPPPAFSARAKLVEVALRPGEGDYFARAIVNRLWHRFFGMGLVTPLDQMHAENPPSHPELLAWLARDMQSHGYDLQRLIRGIVMSDPYARDGRYGSAAAPEARLFAAARLRPLTPMQLATSLKVAATDPQTLDALKPDEFEKRIESMEAAARGFAQLIAQPTDNFQVGVGEALLFSNGERVAKDFLTDGPGTLLGRANAAKDRREAVRMLVHSVLGRPATESEFDALSAYVARRADRAGEAYRQVVWALITGPEFRFNH